MFYTNVQFNLTTKAVDTESRKIEGYATTAGKDRDDEIIPVEVIQTGVDEYLKSGTLLYEHGQDPDFARKPIGKVVSGEVDSTGFRVTATISNEWIWEKISAGELKAFSIGGRAEWETRMMQGEEVGVATKMDIYEVSVVAVPANPEAQFDITKAFVKSLENKLNDNYMNEIMQKLTDLQSKMASMLKSEESPEYKKEEESEETTEEKDHEEKDLTKKVEELEAQNTQLQEENNQLKEEVTKQIKEIDDRLEANIASFKKAQVSQEEETDQYQKDMDLVESTLSRIKR